MKVVFRKSLRPLFFRYLAVGLVLLFIIKIFTVASWSASILFSAFSVGCTILIFYFKDYHRRRITVDDEGIVQQFDGVAVKIRWADAIRVVTGETDLLVKDGIVRVRYAALQDAWRRQIAFSDLSLVGGRSVFMDHEGTAVMSDIANPEFLLAICAKRTGSEDLLRRMRGETAEAQVQPSGEAPQPPEAVAGGAPSEKGKPRSMSLTGIVVLLGKLVAKLGKGLIAALKTVKPGLLIASGAVYGVLFSWKFALALMLMLFVHEYGHVFAMKRSGLKVRGIYFIPFLGAAAVTDDSWRTRAQQAYIALNGPFWGFLLTLVPLALVLFVEGKTLALVSGVAAWWAFINLFNLLPINPLDGGRLLSSLSYSISGKAARAVSLLAFAACIIGAFVFEIHLFVILGLVGLMEFFSEMQTSSQARQLELAGGIESIKPEGLAALRKMTRPLFRDSDEARLQSIDLVRYGRLLVTARINPMGLAAAARWGLFYILLTGAFIAIILIFAHQPGASIIPQILK
jgi:Zn-dependent protease